jgi:hypothetical protein
MFSTERFWLLTERFWLKETRMAETVVRQNVAFEPQDYDAVVALAQEKGLGSRGFSAAVRMIIREWQTEQMRKALSHNSIAVTQAYVQTALENRA